MGAKVFQPSQGEECGSVSDPLGTGSDDERRRDDRKHALKDFENVEQDGLRIVFLCTSPPYNND
jgi:hypothetical protein